MINFKKFVLIVSLGLLSASAGAATAAQPQAQADQGQDQESADNPTNEKQIQVIQFSLIDQAALEHYQKLMTDHRLDEAKAYFLKLPLRLQTYVLMMSLEVKHQREAIIEKLKDGTDSAKEAFDELDKKVQEENEKPVPSQKRLNSLNFQRKLIESVNTALEKKLEIETKIAGAQATEEQIAMENQLQALIGQYVTALAISEAKLKVETETAK